MCPGASAQHCRLRFFLQPMGLGSSWRVVVGGARGWVALAGQCAPGQCEAFPWDCCCAWGCFQHRHSRDVSLRPKELSLDRRLNTCSAAREGRAGGREHLQTPMFPTPTGPGVRLCTPLSLGMARAPVVAHCPPTACTCNPWSARRRVHSAIPTPDCPLTPCPP